MFLLERMLTLLVSYLRPFIKWFLHTFTRLCELQRICYGAQPGAVRTRKVERSLMLSKNADIKHLMQDFDESVEHCSLTEVQERFPTRAVNVVHRVKHIKARSHPDFPALFGACVTQIWSYRQLVHAAERLRAEQYDAENLEHEQKLVELWQKLMPQQPLEGRISKQWQLIGFQGEDPKTDFRGMGILGLENLLYFAREYNDAAQHVLLHSMHPTFGYTFAIVGINLTAMALRLLKSGCAKTHFYNAAQHSKQPCRLEDFHRFYAYLLFEFDCFWMASEPRNIMDFSEIYQLFEINIMEALQSDDALFKTNLVVEGV